MVWRKSVWELACSRRWAAQRPPAILIRTAILTARIARCTLAPTMDLRNATDPDPNGNAAARNAGRRIARCTRIAGPLAPTMDLRTTTDPVASCASCDGLRSSPGDSEPNGDPG